MPRPHCRRWIGKAPPVTLYKPAGIPARTLEIVNLHRDELEAMRLVDAEGLDQNGAAEHMKVSRATVGRLLAAGRAKVADAIVHGKAIAILDGPAELGYYKKPGETS